MSAEPLLSAAASAQQHDSIHDYRRAMLQGKLQQLHALQTEQGKFVSKHRKAGVGSLLITERQANTPSIQVGRLTHGSVIFCIIDSDAPAIVNGIPAKSSLLIMPSEQDTCCIFPEGMQTLSVALPEDLLACQLGDEHFQHFQQQARTALLAKTLPEEANLTLKQLSQYLREVLDTPPPAHSDSDAAAMQDILQLLTTLCQQIKPAWQTVSKASRHRVVVRACRALEENPVISSVQELAKLTHCSARTLEYAFTQTLGLSPKQYLMLWQLHQARDRLSSRKGVSWRQSLADLTIGNYSRFKRAYQQHFGEWPQDTFVNHKTT